MGDTVVLSVPERLVALYLVCLDSRPGGDPVAVAMEAAGRAAPLVRTAVEGATLSGRLAAETVARSEAPLPPAPLLRALGVSASDITRIESCRHVVVLRCLGDAASPPDHELAARHAATALAAALGGVAIDTVVPRVLDPARPAGLTEEFRLADWVVLPHSPDDDGLWFTTKGLARFGLPELSSRGIPTGLEAAWGAVLTGVAHVLLTEHWLALESAPGTAFRETTATHSVSLRDVALGYSDRARAGEDPALDRHSGFRIAVEPALEEGADSFVSIHPPAGAELSTEQWVRTVVTRLFGPALRS